MLPPVARSYISPIASSVLAKVLPEWTKNCVEVAGKLSKQQISGKECGQDPIRLTNGLIPSDDVLDVLKHKLDLSRLGQLCCFEVHLYRNNKRLPDPEISFVGLLIESPLETLHLRNTLQWVAPVDWAFSMPNVKQFKVSGESIIRHYLWRSRSLQDISFKPTIGQYTGRMFDVEVVDGTDHAHRHDLRVQEIHMTWDFLLIGWGVPFASQVWGYRLGPFVKRLAIWDFPEDAELHFNGMLLQIVEYLSRDLVIDLISLSNHDALENLQTIEIHYKKGEFYQGGFNENAARLWNRKNYSTAKQSTGRQIKFKVFDEVLELEDAEDWEDAFGAEYTFTSSNSSI